MKSAYCWVQAARLKSWADVGQMERHGLRRGTPEEFSNCDPDRRHLNQFGSDLPGADPTAVGANLKRKTQEAKAHRRSDAAVAAHLICLASPSFFRPDDMAGIGEDDPKRVEAFRDAALDAVRKRFGPIPAWRMDLDEATPAVDVFLVPLTLRQGKSGEDQYWVSYRDVFGGPSEKLRQLQGWFAESMAPLGLLRGRSVEETGAKRIPLHEQYKLLNRDRAIAEAARVECELTLRRAQEDAASARADRSRAASQTEQAEKIHLAAAEALQGAERREREAEEARLAAHSKASETAQLEVAAQAMVARIGVDLAGTAKGKAAAEALLRDAHSDRASAAEAFRGALRHEHAAAEARRAAASAAAAAADREKAARTAQVQAQVLLVEADQSKIAAARAASHAQEQLRCAEESHRATLVAQAAAEIDRGEAAKARQRVEEAHGDAITARNAAAVRLQEVQGLKDQAAVDRRNAAAQLVDATAVRLDALKLAKTISADFDWARQTVLQEATSIIHPLVEFRDTLRSEIDGIWEKQRGWPSEIRAATDPVLMALVAISGPRMNEALGPLSPADGANPSADALIGYVDAAVAERLTSLAPMLQATLRPVLTQLSEAALAPHHRPLGPRERLAQRGVATPAAKTSSSRMEPT